MRTRWIIAGSGTLIAILAWLALQPGHSSLLASERPPVRRTTPPAFESLQRPIPSKEKIRRSFPEFFRGAKDVNIISIGPNGRGKGVISGKTDPKTGMVRMEDGTTFAGPPD